MEALQIISQSWPIASIAIALLAAIGINLIVRRVTKVEDERIINNRISAQVRYELQRIGQMKTVDDNG